MTTITTRTAKGSALTWTEADDNLTNLNNNKLETANPSSTGTFTHTGDLTIAGTSRRIKGDFNSSTFTNRCLFQNSTINGATSVGSIPNGTNTYASFASFNASDPSNCSYSSFGITDTDARLSSGVTGTGSYLPLTFYTNGAEKMRLDTNGFLGLGITPSSYKLDISGTAVSSFVGARILNTDSGASSSSQYTVATGGGVQGSMIAYGTQVVLIGSDSNHPVFFRTNSTTHMSISTTGSVSFVTPVASGYGTGAGGTVTQGTSRLTAVTIDKPTGRITMVSDTGSSTVNSFVVNNSTVSANDVIIVNQASGTNIYTLRVSNVTTGAFTISFNTTTTSVDAPVINFAVIKGAIS